MVGPDLFLFYIIPFLHFCLFADVQSSWSPAHPVDDAPCKVRPLHTPLRVPSSAVDLLASSPLVSPRLARVQHLRQVAQGFQARHGRPPRAVQTSPAIADQSILS